MATEDGMELRAALARWEALRERWGLDAGEEAALLGHEILAGPVADVVSWSASRLERRTRLLADLGGALDALLLDDDRIRRWLRRPLDSVGGDSPIEAMASSIEWIRRFRDAALDFTP